MSIEVYCKPQCTVARNGHPELSAFSLWDRFTKRVVKCEQQGGLPFDPNTCHERVGYMYSKYRYIT